MTIEKDLISTVIPIYNRPEFLDESIGSLLDQTYQNLEIILVDDGSDEITKTKIREIANLDSRIVVYENETNLGISAARNAGIRFAQGSYIAMMDSDDVSTIDRLHIQHQALSKDNDLIAVGTFAEYVDIEGKTMMIKERPVGYGLLRYGLLRDCKVINPTMMARRKLFENGYYYRDLSPADDYDLWVRVSEKYKIDNIPVVGLKHRIHPTNESIVNSDAMALRSFEISKGALERLLKHPVSDQLIFCYKFPQSKVSREFIKEFANLVNEVVQKASDWKITDDEFLSIKEHSINWLKTVVRLNYSFAHRINVAKIIRNITRLELMHDQRYFT